MLVEDIDIDDELRAVAGFHMRLVTNELHRESTAAMTKIPNPTRFCIPQKSLYELIYISRLPVLLLIALQVGLQL